MTNNFPRKKYDLILSKKLPLFSLSLVSLLSSFERRCLVPSLQLLAICGMAKTLNGPTSVLLGLLNAVWKSKNPLIALISLL